MRMFPERAVKVQAGCKGLLNSINIVKGAGYYCIGIYEQEIPFHKASHPCFKET